MKTRAARRSSLRTPSPLRDLLRVHRAAPEIERRISALDVRSASGPRSEEARTRAATARVELIHLFALTYLPRTADGSALLVRLGRFLEDHAEEIGPELLDALAARLDPRTEGTQR